MQTCCTVNSNGQRHHNSWCVSAILLYAIEQKGRGFLIGLRRGGLYVYCPTPLYLVFPQETKNNHASVAPLAVQSTWESLQMLQTMGNTCSKCRRRNRNYPASSSQNVKSTVKHDGGDSRSLPKDSKTCQGKLNIIILLLYYMHVFEL